MADIDSSTLIAAIQSVDIAIKYQEKPLSAELLGDRAHTEEFIFTLENAKEKLKLAYLEVRKHSDNLPAYESLIQARL